MAEMRNAKNKKVIVAMSGGIDSSVAAALLKKEEYNVIGVFMKFWPRQGRCCSPETEKRARLVAEKLNIPFYVFNFEKEFKKKVVDYFLRNYKSGLTPNPCVVCNKEIKFNLLFKKLKAEYIATGHYARLQEGKLLKGKDKKKDQSYFLWKLDQRILKHTLFPVGDYTKTEVRKLAKKFNLPVLNIPESQEVCFIQTTIADFLRKHLKPKPGPIKEHGKIIGRHEGLYFYTIGQRKRIDLSGGPFYVLDKDLKKNILIVTQNDKDLYKKELIAKDINWISAKQPKFPMKVKAKIRYGHSDVSAIIKKQKNAKIKVVFSRTQRAITPGQSVVFYRSQQLLGGGIIKG